MKCLNNIVTNSLEKKLLKPKCAKIKPLNEMEITKIKQLSENCWSQPFPISSSLVELRLASTFLLSRKRKGYELRHLSGENVNNFKKK
jgi:hypothetical protein